MTDFIVEPKVIISVVVSLMILATGAFTFFLVVNETDFDESQTEYFAVSDPTVPMQCNLGKTPKSITAVYQFDGFDWTEVDSSHYTLSGDVLTVKPSGMI